ncbi:MAG: zinc-binding dehydrogenase [Acidimicrobiales bacterium]|jgi:NADPH2:quinone reductase
MGDSPAETGSVPATAWVAARLGAPTDVLEIRAVDVGLPGPRQVRVATETFCLDFNDIDTIRGRYGLLKLEPPFTVGMVAAGIVDAAGPGAEALLGRRVVGVTVGVQGGYASAALLDAATVQTLPSWLSFVDGAAMYFPYLVGWLALHERGRIKAGDVVLVHAGAGGMGSGVIQLAKAAGATVIATAGSGEKVEFCRQLGADYAVNYRENDFVELVDDVSNGHGVDIAFDSIGGQVTTDTFRTMAFNGRHLIVGFAADITLEERPVSLQPSIYGNFDLVGICFAFVDDPRPTRSLGMNFLSSADGLRIWANILHMMERRQIRPVVGREIDFDDVPGMLEAIERRETVGRTVVRAPRRRGQG